MLKISILVCLNLQMLQSLIKKAYLQENSMHYYVEVIKIMSKVVTIMIFFFFIQRKIKPNLTYLRNKLIESHKINENDEFNIDILKNMLKKRFDEVDFDLVKNDAEHFVFKNEDLSYFSKELFIDMVDTL